MAQQQVHPVVRFVVALLIVIAVAALAFFVGYLIGERLAVVPPALLSIR
jgi:F0F1-type ATP synthase assembly protein I